MAEPSAAPPQAPAVDAEAEAVAAKPRRGQKDPEMLARMRVKAAEVRAENKRIRDAGKLVAAKERAEKLKQADALLGGRAAPLAPPPADSEEEQEQEQEAPHKGHKKGEGTSRKNWKDEYYRLKVARLTAEPAKPAAPPPPVPTAHPSNVALNVARADVKQHFNREVMRSLWQTYFGDGDCPY